MDSKELLKLIKHYNQEYRKGNSEISDQEYDNLVERLRKKDPDNDWFKRIEPAPVAISRKVKLPVPMKSLKKVKNKKEIERWIAQCGIKPDSEIVITPKFDGLSILYNETTTQAYSRGGAENEGQDCTKHIQAAKIATNKKSLLKFTFGEFVFKKEVWNKYFAGKISDYSGMKYRSARNTAAGLINREEVSPTLKRVSFFRYGVDEESLEKFSSYEELYQYLCSNYKQEPLYKIIKANEVTEDAMHSLYREWNRMYFCDGLVLYINDLSIWQSVGRQENTGNPNYAIAYKDPNFTEEYETEVKNITWHVSKAGCLKPIININAVDNGDCNMENPSGYNARYIKNNKLAPGAQVYVTRAGGIIPKITNIIKEAAKEEIDKMWESLKKCPICGKPTKWSDTGTELQCVNPNCDGIKLAKILHFYQTIGCDNVGEETLTQIYNSGHNTLKKMLHISFADLLLINGVGEIAANNVLKINQQILKGVDIATLMSASNCFEMTGVLKAKQIITKMTEGEQWAFINGFINIKPEYFESPEFRRNTKTMQNFYKGIQPFYDFVAENRLAILPMKQDVIVTNNKYSGMNICFSGVRDKLLEDKIIAGGGQVTNNVSKKTTYLVVADKYATSSKIEKATKVKVPIVTIEEFKLK